jgi:hypothetical protein
VALPPPVPGASPGSEVAGVVLQPAVVARPSPIQMAREGARIELGREGRWSGVRDFIGDLQG